MNTFPCFVKKMSFEANFFIKLEFLAIPCSGAWMNRGSRSLCMPTELQTLRRIRSSGCGDGERLVF